MAAGGGSDTGISSLDSGTRTVSAIALSTWSFRVSGSLSIGSGIKLRWVSSSQPKKVVSSSYGRRGLLGRMYSFTHPGVPTHSKFSQVVALWNGLLLSLASSSPALLLAVVENEAVARIAAGKRRLHVRQI